MPTNRYTVGVPYTFQLNGADFFTQPGGPGTQVFPTQQNNTPWADYPIPGLTTNEYVPWFAPGCGHAIKHIKIIPEYDYVNDQPVSLVCCEICTYVQVVQPAADGAAAALNSEGVYNPYTSAIIFL